MKLVLIIGGSETEKDENWPYVSAKGIKWSRGEEEKEKEVMAEERQREKSVNEDGTTEFIKILKRSEYSFIEQLKKHPAQVSILSLLLS